MRFISLLLLPLLAACSTLPTGDDGSAEFAYTHTDDTVIGRKATEVLGDNHQQTVAYLVNEGTEAFLARMAVTAEAERSIDVQYFIWHADLIGKLLFHGLLQAADRGVRVRILLDDINVDEEVESMLYALDQHEYITVHLFNPFASRQFRGVDYLTDMFRVNRRMHNKSFTVDNQVTIFGGRNIGNEYFSADEESNFQDLDVLAFGPVVGDMSKQFDDYWNSKVVFPVRAFDHNTASSEELDALRKTLKTFVDKQLGSKYELDVKGTLMYQRLTNVSSDTQFPQLFRGEVKVIYDDPDKGLGKTEDEVVFLKSLVSPHVLSINDTFEIISPYFVPGDKGVAFLSEMVERGVKVRILTNSLSSTDGILAQSGYSRKRIELLKAGVELYELKVDAKSKASRSLRRSAKAKSGLHAKTYVFDRDEVFIGSYNLDQRSANINAEVGVVFQIPEMANLIAQKVFDESLDDHAYKVELKQELEEVDGIEIVSESLLWNEVLDGKTVQHHTEPDTSAWRRFNQQIFSLLPIESQL